jgi:hypothetical protein
MILFCRDEEARVAFEVKALQRYVDTKPLRDIQRQYLYEDIKQGRFGKVRYAKT